MQHENNKISAESQKFSRDDILDGIAAHIVTEETQPDTEAESVDILSAVHKEHPEIEERAYQIECLDVLVRIREEGSLRALVHMATGLGKTTVAATDVKRFLDNGEGKRVLFLCHQNEILRQARQRFELILGDSERTFGTFTGKQKDLEETTCLFASFQTMKDWREYFAEDEFDYVIVDESHHGKASTYEPTVDYFKPKFLLGLTATPDRQDLQDIREIFGMEVYSRSLAQALAERLLAKPDYRVIVDDIQEGVFEDENISMAELNRTLFLPKRDEEIVRIIQERIEHVRNPKIIAFCPSIEHSRRIAELLPGAMSFHSKLKKKEHDEILNAFREGDIPALVTVDMFNEGVDIADANVIVFLRSTQSETIFLQQLGRGLRKLPDKDSVLVLDFVANCDRLLMIERLLQDIFNGGRAKGKPIAAEETPDDLDIYSINFEELTEELEAIRELQLGSFEFTETTRKILDMIKRIQGIESAPEGWLSIKQFSIEVGISRPIVYKVIEDFGWEPKKFRFSGKIGDALSPQQAATLLAHPLVSVEVLDQGSMTLRSFCERHNVTYSLVNRLLSEWDTELPIQKLKNGGRTVKAAIINSELQARLLEVPEVNTPPPPDGYLSINGFAKTLGVSPTTIGKAVDELGLELPRYKYGPKIARGLNRESQEAILKHMPGLTHDSMPENYTSIRGLARHIGISESTISNLVKKLGVPTSTHAVKGHIARTLGPKAQALIVSSPELTIQLAPEGCKSLYTLAQKLSSSRPTLERMCEELGIDPGLYRFGTRYAQGLTLDEQARMVEAMQK